MAGYLLGTIFLAGKYGAAAARALPHCLNSIDGRYWALSQPNKCTLSVTVQRITLLIKAPMLLGCKPCTCLLMAEDFHSWCVLVIIFPCSGLTDCSLACSVGWELGNATHDLGESAVSSVDHKARKSKETWILLFLVVIVCSSSYLQVFLCCLNSDSKNHMLLVVKELTECALIFLFCFSCSARSLILGYCISLLCIYLFHLYSFLL